MKNDLENNPTHVPDKVLKNDPEKTTEEICIRLLCFIHRNTTDFQIMLFRSYRFFRFDFGVISQLVVHTFPHPVKPARSPGPRAGPGAQGRAQAQGPGPGPGHSRTPRTSPSPPPPPPSAPPLPFSPLKACRRHPARNVQKLNVFCHFSFFKMHFLSDSSRAGSPA